jgi:hypothetical protein
MASYALIEKAIVLKPEDDVAVARRGHIRALDHRPGHVTCCC